MAMARYFSCVSSLVRKERLQKGQLIAVCGRGEVTKRARITRLLLNDKVETFAIDEGIFQEVERDHIFVLPQRFDISKYPPMAKLVVVCGLLPMDGDVSWSNYTHRVVSTELLGHNKEKGVVCRGRVAFHFSDTIWLASCQLLVRQQSVSRYVLQFETVQTLEKKGLAKKNPDHIKVLDNLYKQIGVVALEHPADQNDNAFHMDNNMNVVHLNLPPLQLIEKNSPTAYIKKVPTINWRQSRRALTLNICVESFLDLTSDQVYISIADGIFQFQTIEATCQGYILTQTPHLSLWGQVSCQHTTVKIQGPKVIVSLTKAASLFWKQLMNEKYDWIRRDASDDWDGDSSEEEEPLKRFTSEEKLMAKLRKITREEAVAEEALQSSQASCSTYDYSDEDEEF